MRVKRICSKKRDFEKNSAMILGHFLRRGYPLNELTNALDRACQMERKDTLTAKEPTETEKTDEKTDEKTFYLITKYNPANSQHLKGVVNKNWGLLKRSSATKHLAEKRVVFGTRKEKNLKDILVRAKLAPLEEVDAERKPCSQTINACRSKRLCNHCPLMNREGRMKSTSLGIEFACKKNITCRSSNLIYCIQCKRCKIQYVGETRTTLMKRMQGHRDRIERRVLSDDVGKHFNTNNHKGMADYEIFVLDFVYCAPMDDHAAPLRLLIENNWIHRLNTQRPWGLNFMEKSKADLDRDKAKDTNTKRVRSRNWKHYKKGRP